MKQIYSSSVENEGLSGVRASMVSILIMDFMKLWVIEKEPTVCPLRACFRGCLMVKIKFAWYVNLDHFKMPAIHFLLFVSFHFCSTWIAPLSFHKAWDQKKFNVPWSLCLRLWSWTFILPYKASKQQHNWISIAYIFIIQPSESIKSHWQWAGRVCKAVNVGLKKKDRVSGSEGEERKEMGLSWMSGPGRYFW